MAKVPVVRNLRIEDFPSENKWIGNLLLPLNVFINYTVLALTRSLTFADNVLSQANVLQVNFQSNTFPLVLGRQLSSPPLYGTVGYATEGGLGIGAVMAWDLTDDGNIRIVSVSKVSNGTISALTVGTNYYFRFLFYS